METELALWKMFNNVWPHLGERERRLVAASEARRIGRKGISMVSRACGLSRVTITKGIKELDEAPLPHGKTRRAGAGRPRVERIDPGIWASLETLLRESTDSESNPTLLWTTKSTRKLAKELTERKHRISHEKVAQILRQNGFCLQGTRRNDDNNVHPDRRSQFKYINNRVIDRVNQGEPVIAIETRRRESAFVSSVSGDRFMGSGSLGGDQLALGRYPTGIYDPLLARNSVNVETAIEPSTFTADSIFGWWQIEGQEFFPKAKRLFVTADGLGAPQRTRWKIELQKLSNAIGLPVEFSRFPQGTAKWNVPSQRLFSFVTSHWLGEGEKDHEISARIICPPKEVRTMALGLRLDHTHFQSSRDDAEDTMNLFVFPSEFHGDWNFTINPDSFGSYRLNTVYNNRNLPTVSM
ncbi:MAG: ISAzo13 family transposase [Deltaproteobacteria bacterium]|jgi:hypothetical protein|nr:ISAzo13 family transposase [Deltaproteobacteria bacterium]